MKTKEFYKMLDKVLPKGLCYNLRKKRNTPIWRIRVWVSKTLDRMGIRAPYIEDELYPENYEIDDTIADFRRICEVAVENCS